MLRCSFTGRFDSCRYRAASLVALDGTAYGISSRPNRPRALRDDRLYQVCLSDYSATMRGTPDVGCPGAESGEFEMPTTDDDMYGELSREECPIDECDGERVRTQSRSLPLGCSEMKCTGKCGAYKTFEGHRQRGSAMRVKYDASRIGFEQAYSCPTEECDEVVPAEFGCNVEGMPYTAPDDIESVSMHCCAECDTSFDVGETQTSERRIVELTEE